MGKPLKFPKITIRRLFLACSLIICILLLPKTKVIMKQEQEGVNMEQLNLSTLIREKDRFQLIETGFLCNSNLKSEVCVTTKQVRINTQSLNIYISPTSKIDFGINDTKIIKPYARQGDNAAMRNIQPLQIIQTMNSSITQPVCDHTHTVPVVIFSVGGYTGNTFHSYSEILVPLFLSTRHFQSQVRFLITNYNPVWVKRYDRILKQLSSYEIISADKNNGSVHCFPGGVFGLKCHGILTIDSTRTPKGYNIDDFREFLVEAYDLKVNKLLVKPTKPVVLLVSRKGNRMWLNEDEIVNMMVELGFEVRIAIPDDLKNLENSSSLVNSCHVLVGVHGAGIINSVFLPSGAVTVQVVPIGLNMSAKMSYGNTIPKMNLKYLEYFIEVEESSLYESYSHDDPVLVNPKSLYAIGYSYASKIYHSSQNVRINVTRFRDTMAHAFELLQS